MCSFSRPFFSRNLSSYYKSSEVKPICQTFRVFFLSEKSKEVRLAWKDLLLCYDKVMTPNECQNYLPWFSSLTLSFLRPFARRAASTLRPPTVCMRWRNPCLLFLFLLWGWNVLFILYLFYYFRIFWRAKLLYFFELTRKIFSFLEIFQTNLSVAASFLRSSGKDIRFLALFPGAVFNPVFSRVRNTFKIIWYGISLCLLSHGRSRGSCCCMSRYGNDFLPRHILCFPMLNIRSPMRNICSAMRNIHSPSVNINSQEEEARLSGAWVRSFSPFNGPPRAFQLRFWQILLYKLPVIENCNSFENIFILRPNTFLYAGVSDHPGKGIVGIRSGRKVTAERERLQGCRRYRMFFLRVIVRK